MHNFETISSSGYTQLSGNVYKTIRVEWKWPAGVHPELLLGLSNW